MAGFEPRPRLAVAVSGGADSTCLALLAAGWARAQGGEVLALIVDHGLRPESAGEARTTRGRMAAEGIPAMVLTLDGLQPGPGLAARARQARLDALVGAAKREGMLHLLLGHHEADQAETLLMRGRAGSGADGLAGIAAVRELPGVRILRPLLQVAPGRLRGTLRARGVGWVEDPSNLDQRQQRPRLRAELRDAAPNSAELIGKGRLASRRRASQQACVAAELAACVSLSPLGYAVIAAAAVAPATLSALWQAVSGRPYPPPSRAIDGLASELRPATLAGLRLLPAGRLGPGWLLVAEHGAPCTDACDGARWGRFTMRATDLPAGCMLAALGDSRAAVRSFGLPACVLRVLPAVFRDGALASVPSLGWAADPACGGATMRFTPAVPATAAPWAGSFELEGCLTTMGSLC